MKKKRILPILAVLAVIVIGVFIKSQSTGQIIGNPDYEPSFRNVNKDTFISALKDDLKTLELPAEVEVSSADNWDSKFILNKNYTVLYDEGYIQFLFKSQDIDADFDEILKYITAFIMTLDQRSQEAVSEDIRQVMHVPEPGQDINWKDLFLFGETLNIHFDSDTENNYEVHFEDNRMSY